MMKKMKFKDIHSLEDIVKVKRQLKKKVRVTEKSFSDRTDLRTLLLNDNKSSGSLFSEDNWNPEMLWYLLPLGIKRIFTYIQKKSNKKQFKRILKYSAIGSVLAFSAYQILVKRKDETDD